MNNNKLIISKKVAFILILIIFFTAAIFEILWLLEKEKFEKFKLNSIKLTKIQLAMMNSCIDYCNITQNKSLEIFKEYLYRDNFKHLKEIE